MSHIWLSSKRSCKALSSSNDLKSRDYMGNLELSLQFVVYVLSATKVVTSHDPCAFQVSGIITDLLQRITKMVPQHVIKYMLPFRAKDCDVSD